MKGDICSVENCNKIVRSSNICEIHSWRMRTYKSYDKPSRKIYDDKCRVATCDNPRDIKQRSSLCIMHRVRMSRHKSLELPEKPNLPDGIAYICEYHGERSSEQAYKNPKDGYYSCIECRNLSKAKRKALNPTEHHRMKRNFYFFGKINPRFKISVIEYNVILEEQNGVCKICKKPETMRAGKCRKYTRGEQDKKSSKRLAIDHCHKTWEESGILKIRGLLCHRCNTGIGGFYDSIELLQSAITYLKANS